jgi:hypothetical protein
MKVYTVGVLMAGIGIGLLIHNNLIKTLSRRNFEQVKKRL